jgi:hypothetical protein
MEHFIKIQSSNYRIFFKNDVFERIMEHLIKNPEQLLRKFL